MDSVSRPRDGDITCKRRNTTTSGRRPRRIGHTEGPTIPCTQLAKKAGGECAPCHRGNAHGMRCMRAISRIGTYQHNSGDPSHAPVERCGAETEAGQTRQYEPQAQLGRVQLNQLENGQTQVTNDQNWLFTSTCWELHNPQHTTY